MNQRQKDRLEVNTFWLSVLSVIGALASLACFALAQVLPYVIGIVIGFFTLRMVLRRMTNRSGPLS